MSQEKVSGLVSFRAAYLDYWKEAGGSGGGWPLQWLKWHQVVSFRPITQSYRDQKSNKYENEEEKIYAFSNIILLHYTF